MSKFIVFENGPFLALCEPSPFKPIFLIEEIFSMNTIQTLAIKINDVCFVHMLTKDVADKNI